MPAVSATLVLREIQQQQTEQIRLDPTGFLQPCDVAAFVFDGSDLNSLHAAQDLLFRVADLANDTLPCVLVAAKDDLGTSLVSIALSVSQGH